MPSEVVVSRWMIAHARSVRAPEPADAVPAILPAVASPFRLATPHHQRRRRPGAGGTGLWIQQVRGVQPHKQSRCAPAAGARGRCHVQPDALRHVGDDLRQPATDRVDTERTSGRRTVRLGGRSRSPAEGTWARRRLILRASRCGSVPAGSGRMKRTDLARPLAVTTVPPDEGLLQSSAAALSAIDAQIAQARAQTEAQIFALLGSAQQRAGADDPDDPQGSGGTPPSCSVKFHREMSKV